MAIKRPALKFLLTCFLAVSGGTTAYCMDLSIAPSSLSHSAPPRSVAHGMAQKSLTAGRQTRAPITPEKARRHQKLRKNKITSYSLSNDPIFKRGDMTLDGGPRGGITSGIKGVGAGYGISGAASSALHAVPNFKTEPTDNAGIAFDCRKKSSLTSLEVTACYVHKVDKAWKTQTYVTKGLTDSNPSWGGGLSVGYAY